MSAAAVTAAVTAAVNGHDADFTEPVSDLTTSELDRLLTAAQLLKNAAAAELIRREQAGA